MRELKISVVIPAYNAAEHIERAIDSVIAQTYPPEEIIVIDDGSSDSTSARLAKYASQIRVISQMNMGASRARNRGILEARSELIAFLDSDDYWKPQKLFEQVKLFRRDSSVGFVSCNANVEDSNGVQLNSWVFEQPRSDLLHTLFVRHAGIPGSLSAVLARRSLFAEVGLFDVALTSQEDIDMWIRLSARTAFACVEQALATITRQPGSVSSNYFSMLDCARQVMRKNRALLPKPDQRRFWQCAYGGMLTDYAKWAYRNGNAIEAIRLTIEAAIRSPRHWRLSAALILAVVRRDQL